MVKQWMAGLVALWSVGAWAQDLCAVVLIEIAQEMTLERQGFEATMRINNGLDSIALNELKVQVLFEDDDGNTVVASSDPNATDAAFFIRLDDSQNVTDIQSGSGGSITSAVVPAKAAGVLRWLIIPTAGAAGDGLGGKRYAVGATLSYNAGGKVETLSVAPDSITVKPQPQLTLDYFLTREVIADDAFTPQIESPEPYTLGVRARNSGRGEAKSLKIESAQPRIIGNEQGLAINFRITHGFVDEAPAAPSLLLDFGSIAPGRNRNGRWVMESTLSGKFVDFSATFSHPDELGGRMTSLLDATNAYMLLRDVRVDLPARDGVRDFLAHVGTDLYVFESDSVGQDNDSPCFDCSKINRLNAVLVGGSMLRTLEVVTQPGMGYVRVPDPYRGGKGLQRVVRSDGRVLLPANAWLSKERGADGRSFDYYLNVFDVQPDAHYSVHYGELTAEPRPPVFQYIADRSTQEGGQVGFLVRASDPNGTIPALSAEGLPTGATFKDEGQGRGTFHWLPLVGQAGRYVVNFRATDGELDSRLPVNIRVFSQNDGDGDGMDDDWELEQFGNLDRDGTGDYDGDGISDLDEFENGSDPKQAASAPLPPQLHQPADNAHVPELYPALRVRNSLTRLPGQSLNYWFEVYADAAMSELVARSPAVAEGSTSTEWLLKPDALEPGQDLHDNRRYFWRARVSHDEGHSEWLNGRFFINTANDAPSAPVLLSPTPLGLVADTRPEFRFNNAIDLDEDALVYRVRVFSEDDENFSQPVAEVSGLQPGAGGETLWRSPVELPANRFYFWLVEARDPHGAITVSEPSLFGVGLDNQPPSAPTLAWPAEGQQVTQSGALVLRLGPAVDPENRPLSYRIQLDDNERFDGAERLDSDWFAASGEAIQWTVPTALAENRTYHWRARASDGELESTWVVGSFQINRQSEAPPTPVADNPGQGAWIETRSPRLAVHPVIDPDGDALSYEFELETAEGLALARQVAEQPNWTPGLALDDNSWFRWRVRALDATGLASAWSDWLSFFVNENGVDDPPTFSFVQPAEDLVVSGGSVVVQWLDADPDSSATIDLYANGRLIVAGIPEDEDGDGDRYVHSLAGVPPGVYRISAIIRDATSEVRVDACCTVTVRPPAAEVQVTPLTSLEIDEYGEAIAEIEVRLGSAPKPGQSVTLNLALSDTNEARLLNPQPYLYFTAENWQQPQRIRVQGVDDCAIDGDREVGLQLLPLHSSDLAFDGLDPADVLLVNRDNEQPGQELFICHANEVSRTAVDADGMQEITLRPELLNRGSGLMSASASASLNGSGVALVGNSSLTFGQALTGIRTPALETLTIRQPANLPVQLQRVHWQILPGAPTTERQAGDEGGELRGTGANDVLRGGAGSDHIIGGAGNDVIIGGSGEDRLEGGSGDDTFIVEGNDPFVDHFLGGSGYDRILGGEGDDVVRMTQFGGTYFVELIDGGGGHNRIEGTADADRLDLRQAELRNIDLIDGLAGDDWIRGSQGNDRIAGGAGNDELLGDAGDDVFLVQGQDQGYDRVQGGPGFDTILGSEGDDRIGLSHFADTYKVERIDGLGGRNVIAGDDEPNILDFSSTELLNIALIDGGAGNDVITGSASNDTIKGGAGEDIIRGGGGDDTFLFEGAGEYDQYFGDAGFDRLMGSANSDVLLLRGFGPDNSIEEIDGNGGVNLIRGTSDADVLDFSATRLQAIGLIEGLAGDDQIIGSDEADTIDAGPGLNVVNGRGGDDTFLVDSQSGASTYIGGAGFDRILGTPDDDIIRLERFDGENRVERIDGGDGVNVIAAGSASGTGRTFDFSATELIGIEHIQVLPGAQVMGSAGDDRLVGDASVNIMGGGPGNDVLMPGRGNDQVSGGAGDDLYVFEGGRDFIEDRGLAEDQDRLLLNLPPMPLERIWLVRSGEHLQLLFEGYTDQVTIRYWFTRAGDRLARIELPDGRYLPAANVEALRAVMASMSRSSGSRSAQEDQTLQQALTNAWIQP